VEGDQVFFVIKHFSIILLDWLFFLSRFVLGWFIFFIFSNLDSVFFQSFLKFLFKTFLRCLKFSIF